MNGTLDFIGTGFLAAGGISGLGTIYYLRKWRWGEGKRSDLALKDDKVTRRWGTAAVGFFAVGGLLDFGTEAARMWPWL